MTGGFSDTVYISWFGDGLSGQDVGMKYRSFMAGLKELLNKGFLAPRTPNVFWVNPHLFFKGDRVAFVQEYCRPPSVTLQNSPSEEARAGETMRVINGQVIENE
jgi:hypothetical protein